MTKFFYKAVLRSGSEFETVIEGNEGSIADVEAKIEVERWLAEEGDSSSNLTAFDRVFQSP